MSAQSQKSVAYFYDEEIGNYCYGGGNPMRPHRARMTYSLVNSYGLTQKMLLHRPRARTFEELTAFHADGGAQGALAGAPCRGYRAAMVMARLQGVLAVVQCSWLRFAQYPALVDSSTTRAPALPQATAAVPHRDYLGSGLVLWCPGMSPSPCLCVRLVQPVSAPLHAEYINFLRTVTPNSVDENMTQLRRFNMGIAGEADCPVFDGMYEYCQVGRFEARAPSNQPPPC